MGRDHLTRYDSDTRWLYGDHARKLQRLHPTDWPVYWCAYQAVLAESWWEGTRITLEAAWSPVIPCALQDATEALQEAGLLDRSGRVTAAAWRTWYEPVAARMGKRSTAGAIGAKARWDAERAKKADATRANGVDRIDATYSLPSGGEPRPDATGDAIPRQNRRSGAMRSHSVPDAPSQPSKPSKPAIQEPHPNGAGDDPPDVLDAWFRLTGSWPSRKVIPWLEELSRDHGEVEVSSALAAELLADDDRKTLLSRTQARLERDEHHAAKVRAAREAEAAAAERARIEAMPAEQRAANMARLRAELEASGIVPPKAP